MKRRNTCASPRPSSPHGPSQTASSRRTRKAAVHAALEVRESPIHGQGVFAKRAVSRDTLLGVYEGQPVQENDIYVLWVEYDDGEVVGIDGKNALRYVNHSRTPNAEFWGDELYALADIPAGAEITVHYGEDWEHVE